MHPALRDATLYRLRTISESARLLSRAVKDRRPDVPKAAIAGVRNCLVHGVHGSAGGTYGGDHRAVLAPLRDAAREELLQLRRERGQGDGPDIGFSAGAPRGSCKPHLWR